MISAIAFVLTQVAYVQRCGNYEGNCKKNPKLLPLSDHNGRACVNGDRDREYTHTHTHTHTKFTVYLLDSIIEQTRFILCAIKFEQNDRAGGR